MRAKTDSKLGLTTANIVHFAELMEEDHRVCLSGRSPQGAQSFLSHFISNTVTFCSTRWSSSLFSHPLITPVRSPLQVTSKASPGVGLDAPLAVGGATSGDEPLKISIGSGMMGELSINSFLHSLYTHTTCHSAMGLPLDRPFAFASLISVIEWLSVLLHPYLHQILSNPRFFFTSIHFKPCITHPSLYPSSLQAVASPASTLKPGALSPMPRAAPRSKWST